MTTPTPADHASTAPDHVEHRFALVLNGGVSLAVWMGGVAREIDNARRASDGIAPPDDATDAEREVHRLWAAAFARRNLRLTVDVIAGTSAGGLNGVLLAAAIARGTPLSKLKDLWLTAGQLAPDALLTPQGDNPLSLMNGDFFHEQIVHALDAMPGDPDPATHRDVSLVVTSTALGGSSRPVADTRGRRFGAADHRRRYHFTKHPPRPTYNADGAANQFGAGPARDDFTGAEPLATAARATASFPAAFKPVRETPELRAHRVFPDWVTDDARDWLADGGILDNSPFDPVLQSIQNKPVTGAWRRTVVFVEPDADDVARGDIAPPSPTAHDDAADPPPPWTSVVLAALNFPGEISFRDDVEHLHAAIRDGRSTLDIDRFHTLTDGPEATTMLAAARDVCGKAVVLYQQSAVIAAVTRTREVILRRRPNAYLDPAAKVGAYHVEPGEHDWLPQGFPRAGDPLPESWQWGVDAAGRVLRTLLRATSHSMPAPARAADVPGLRSALSVAADRVTAVGRALDLVLGETPTDASLADPATIALLDEGYAALDIARTVAPIVADAVRRYAAVVLGADEAASDVLAAALSIEVGNGAGAIPDNRPRPLFDFDRLGLDDPPPLLRAAYEAALGHPANGSAASTRPRNNILFGSRLSHFAAFAEPAWRQWDWLWGRLTALAHLATLFDLDAETVDDLTRAVIAAEGHTLEYVEAEIGRVVALDAHALQQELLTARRVPPVVDALLEFVRSDATTAPPLLKPLVSLGQLLSDVLARQGHHGRVKHHVLRALGGPARKHVVWRRLDPKG